LSGRGLCDELITRPEESYRLWCVVVCDLEMSRIGAPYVYMTLVTQGLTVPCLSPVFISNFPHLRHKSVYRILLHFVTRKIFGKEQRLKFLST